MLLHKIAFACDLLTVHLLVTNDTYLKYNVVERKQPLFQKIRAQLFKASLA